MQAPRAGLLLAALIVAACGGGSNQSATTPGGPAATGSTNGGATLRPTVGNPTNPPGGPAGDACALLTADDIREVSGLEVTSATPESVGGIFKDGCHWVLADADSMVPAEILLGVMASGGREYYGTYFKPFYSDFGYEPISGLGDEAADTGEGAVMALAGDAIVDVQYLALKPDDTEMATELLRKALANLGS